MREVDIQRQILDFLKYRNVFAWRSNTGAVKYNSNNGGRPRFVRFGKAGCSDIIGIYKGRMIAIEVKKQDTHPSVAQQEFINEINKRGGIAFVARSIEEVAQQLNLML